MDAGEIIDGIPVGVAVLDTDFKFQAMNKALEALTGFSREEAVGIPCRYIVRNNLCLTNCPAKEALKSEETVRVEGDIINRARKKIPVMITVSPIKDAKGELIGLIETLEDISLVQELDKQVHIGHDFGGLIGHSPQMHKVFNLLPIIAQTDSSVLIMGETGTGKDLIASVIHRLSQRVQGMFIKVNCGALPETLLESELFGHTRGAFTGAVRDKPGRFQLAHNGTIFLTEIGDLHLGLQVKLLTVLDDKEVFPVGATRSVKANVRVVAGTHRDLKSMVQQGTFREDLLFRLNVVRIDVPPLRDRGQDVRLLMEHFLNHFKKKFKRNIKGFQEGTIQPDHLPEYLEGDTFDFPTSDPAAGFADKTQAKVRPQERFIRDLADEALDWRHMERRMISEALLQSRGNRTRAAELLGWGRSTLWRKMKQYSLI
ncbi:MAG: sigma 54-interacting transcriptional regulator [Deltaproteobacteria bacterium]|nr:sigma 54-interacting transcriptional regulator [Deltaproteobacteria bacterium]